MFRKTVDGVLSALTRAVTDLESVIEQRLGENGVLAEKIEALGLAHGRNVAEISRARRVKERLEELLS